MQLLLHQFTEIDISRCNYNINVFSLQITEVNIGTFHSDLSWLRQLEHKQQSANDEIDSNKQ